MVVFVVHLHGVWRVMGSLNQLLLFECYGGLCGASAWSVACDGLPQSSAFVRELWCYVGHL